MATDNWAWTVSVPLAELTIDSRDWVVYQLQDPVSEAMAREDAITTMSSSDQFHYQLRALIRTFGATALAFLDREPSDPDEREEASADSDGFITSALLPEDIPAARAEIDAMLHDTARLSQALEIKGLSDADLAKWREDAFNGNVSSDDDIVWFLLRLEWVLDDAHGRGDAVVHVNHAFP